MPNFKEGKIYKLWSIEGDKIYIGSTVQPLYKRLSSHRNIINKCNSKLLFEIYENVKIELIEEFPCENKQQLNKREGEIMRINKEFIVNSNIAGRTNKEYCKDNIEKVKEKSKEYKQKNKQKIKEQQKEYYKEHCEENKEEKKEYKKEWYKRNKEKKLNSILIS